MNARTLLALVLFLALGAVSVVALRDHGYVGLFQYQLLSTAGWQVLLDLVVACVIGLLWMFDDARRVGRNPWPYAGITLLFGSFGLLAYLLVGAVRRAPTAGYA